MPQKERQPLFFHEVRVTIKVHGPLYASSPTTMGGIVAALKRNKPTEGQKEYREAVGEEIKSQEELAKEIKDAVPEGEPGKPKPSTVFRRDKAGQPYLHANYFKGHLRECGESLSRTIDFWGLQGFVTKTVFVKPDALYLAGDIKELTTFFAPDVRLSSGVTVRQATEKVEEFVESPVLKWVLYLVGDPRWDRNILEEMLRYGSVRGIGPGRGRCESQYEFDLGEFKRVDRVPMG